MASLASDIEAMKLKSKLKQWELNFLQENTRKPSKDDIATSSEEIRTMYKDYYKISQERKAAFISKPSLEAKEVQMNVDIKPDPWGSDLNKSNCEKKLNVKKPSSVVQHFGNKLRVHANLQRTKSVKASVQSSESSLVEADVDMLFKPQFKVKLTDQKRESLTKGKALTPISTGNLSVSLRNTQVFLSSQNMLHKNATVDQCSSNNSQAVENIASNCLGIQKGSSLLCQQSGKPVLQFISSNLDTTPRSLSKDESCATIVPKSNVANDKTEPVVVPNVKDCSKDIFEFKDEQETDALKTNPNTSKRTSQAPKKTNRVMTKTRKPRKYVSENDSESVSEISTKTRKRKAQTRCSSAGVKKRKLSEETENTESKSPEGKKCTRRESANKQSGKYLNEDELEALARPSRKVSSKKTWRNGKKTTSSNNYVRINLKKKVFCRGKKQFNYRRYKFEKWKELQQSKDFKEEQCDDENNSESDNEILVAAANDVSIPAEISMENSQSVEEMTAEELDSNLSEYSVTEPMFALDDGQLSKSALAKVQKVLHLFGHTSFRDGQLQAVTRILAGLSTLVIQPTGTGKSLCYLLPAYMYSQRFKCTALVVSPLVSLMEDQLLRVPSCLKAACIHTNMTTTQRKKVKDAVSRGNVHVLFVSPESLVGSAGSPYGILPQDMPPISFVCIDEVHCVSMWSHNFRPTYLRLCRVIREKLQVRCILGLTATATMNTIENIVTHLELKDEAQSVIRGTVLPPNLQLTVSRDHKEEALLNLLRREPYSDCKSIIIYCIRRDQTERLASLIRTSLQDCKEEWSAEAYHAGLVPSRRRSVQNQFMTGKLRVVVATVAFGMGLNKADVRAVIHYNLPKSIESYVQEIGRAGRDGEQAYCHVFLDQNGEDCQELRRHIYANTVDRAALGKLMKLVFNRCKCKKLQQMEKMLSNGNLNGEAADQMWRCKGHEVAFSVDDAVEQLDIKEEGIETILCNLEMHPNHYIQLLNRMYGTCSVFCYGGTDQLTNLIAQCRPVAIAAALDKKVERRKMGTYNGHQTKDNTLEFPLVKIASLMGCKASDLRKQLSKLQWNEVKGANGEIKYCKSGIVVDFKDLSFHVRAVGDLDDDEKDAMLNDLHNCITKQEQMELEQLENFYAILNKVSFPHQSSCKGETVNKNSQILKDIIREYFENSKCPDLAEFGINTSGLPQAEDVSRVAVHIRQFLSIHYGENNFSGRAVARIFHGIGSPRYPAEIWGRVRQFWRSQLNFDFNVLCKMSTEEILRFR